MLLNKARRDSLKQPDSPLSHAMHTAAADSKFMRANEPLREHQATQLWPALLAAIRRPDIPEARAKVRDCTFASAALVEHGLLCNFLAFPHLAFDPGSEGVADGLCTLRRKLELTSYSDVRYPSARSCSCNELLCVAAVNLF